MITPGDPAARARLRWRCRRGMRELDLVLTRYVDTNYDLAPPHHRAAFERLLNRQDPEILALLSGRIESDDRHLQDVIQLLLDPD